MADRGCARRRRGGGGGASGIARVGIFPVGDHRLDQGDLHQSRGDAYPYFLGVGRVAVVSGRLFWFRPTLLHLAQARFGVSA